MNKKIVIQGWLLHKIKSEYYIPYTQLVYLKEISKYYEEICLLSPVKKTLNTEYRSLKNIKGIVIYDLPFNKNYLNAIKKVLYYIKAFSVLSKKYDIYYVRFPNPFGWLSKIFFANKKRIIHFVGDPIDVIKNNPNFNSLKKNLLLFFFRFEFRAYIWACKGATVFSNGYHIADKLKKYQMNITPLISSTLIKKDFCFNIKKEITKSPKLLYVGGLRTAKGVEIIISAFSKIIKKYSNAKLTIAGEGEFEKELKSIVTKKELDSQVDFLGHIDSRKKLNKLYRAHDIFLFASLSEGSPRVILEAMANGLPVVSTPVGSLPVIFEDKKEIIFAKFNNDDSFFEKIDQLIQNKKIYKKTKINAFKKVQKYTIDKFIKRIFTPNNE
ncbi:glycosyltransferase family 4 protein [Patescibacteria group bacterium]|nr:glycosyltransferase family 4 protein [Patescibacteria group bacterium]